MSSFRLLFVCAAALPIFAAMEQPIRTGNGMVSGLPGRNPTVQVYKGIPFAAPPTGDLRWKAPRAAATWQGVKTATDFSPVCFQTAYPAGSVYDQAPKPMSEDCLYLNVWTAARSPKDRRPVMVWVHGGGLTRGSGSVETYDGEALASKGVVLVTINYRLGVFGFLAHPELTKESDRNASGNYAFLDQMAALEWVQKNIAGFGGDPGRVTIFGESAGSWSVNYLMATPLAKGLFQRAIGESGGAFAPMKTLAEAEQIGLKLGASVQALRAKPADELLKETATSSFPPNVDGWLLPRDVYTIFAEGKQNDVPLIVGSNANEATTLSPWPATAKADAFVSQIKQRFGAASDEALRIYPADNDEQARESHYTSFRDFTFGWEMRTWARMQTKTGKSKAYLYYFSHRPPGPTSARLGAFHASEIAYVFGNLSPARPWEQADHKLSDEMTSYWVNFAGTGDPNGNGLPRWAAYETASDTALEFGDTVKAVTALNKPALDFLDRYFAEARKK